MSDAKRAQKLLRRCRCAPQRYLAQTLAALKACTGDAAQDGNSLNVVQHNLDLDTDEPSYAVAWARLEAARLLMKGSMGALDDALQHLLACLALFPSYVAAHYAAALIWRQACDSREAIIACGHHLEAAVAAAAAVKAQEDGMLVSSGCPATALVLPCALQPVRAGLIGQLVEGSYVL